MTMKALGPGSVEATVDDRTERQPRDGADAPGTPSAREEWAKGKGVLIACFVGMMISIGTLPFYSAGVFISHLHGDFGWSRTQISAGTTILMVGVAVASPVFGYIIDRWSARVTIVLSGAAMSIAFLLLSRMQGQLWAYYATMAFMALFGAGCSPLSFSRVVNSRFHRMRGTALGLSQAGSGASSAISTYLIVLVIAHHGWRSGYLALAVTVFAAMPLIWLLTGAPAQRGARAPAAAILPSADFDKAIKDPTSWMLFAAILCASLAVGGMIVYFVPMAVANGVTIERASAIAGLIGVSIVTARVAAGFLMDRIFAPWIGVAIFGVGALGCLALAFGGPDGAYFGAIAIGLCAGTEMDLVAYLTARYFGMQIFGRLYGLLYVATMIGSGSAPLLYGFVADQTGGYRPALMISIVMYLSAAAIMLILPKFPAATRRRA